MWEGPAVLKMILTAMPYAVYALLAAYALAWFVLLAGCLRRGRFWPIFDTDRQTRWFWLASFAFLNPFLTGMYYVFAHRRAPDAPPGRIGPVQVALTVAVVAIAGFFVKVPPIAHLWMVPLTGWGQGGPPRPGGLRTHAATIETRTNSSVTTVSSRVGNARLACRRVAVFVEDNHPLTARIGADLCDALGELPMVAEVVLCAAGHVPTAGQVRPDLFLRLATRDLHVTPIPYAVTLRAEIDVAAGPSPWHHSSSHAHGSDPPILDFSWTATLRHKSRTTGYESVRFGLASRDIAKTIAKDLGKKLTQWLSGSGPVPSVDESLMGTYRKVDLPEPLRALGARRICSYRALLTHNETLWRLDVPKESLSDRIEAISKALVADGWRKESSDERTVRAERGTQRIDVQQTRGRVRTGWVPTGEAKASLTIRLRDVFSADERRIALEDLLTDSTPVDTLLFFSSLFHKDQKLRLIRRFEQHPGVSLPVQVYLIDHYLGRKEYDKASAGLRRARALQRGLWKPSESQSKLDNASKKLARATGLDEPPKPSPPPIADFRDAGFALLDANTPSFEREVGLREPGALVYEGEKGLRTLMLRVIESPDRAHRTPYAWECVESSRPGSRSRSVVPGTAGTDGLWSASHNASVRSGPRIRARVHALPTPGRFVVKARLDPPRPRQPAR